MDDFVKFLGKYGQEALGIADALNEILGSVALSPAASAKVDNVIDKLRAVAGNVADYKPTKVVIKKSDIEAAVAAKLPAIMNEEITKAVAAALAAKEAEDAAKEAEDAAK